MAIDYSASVITTANKYGVDPSLALAVMQAESSGNPNAQSSAGAIGLFQLMPSTAQWLGVDPNDPIQNIEGGVKYLSQLLDQFNGDTTLALAAYNAGPGNVTKYGGVPPFVETQNYVSKILGLLGVSNVSSLGSSVSNDSGNSFVSSDTGGVSLDLMLGVGVGSAALAYLLSNNTKLLW